MGNATERVTALRGTEAAASGGPRVVVVDDDEALGALADAILSAAGYRVTVCHHPREALRLVAEDPSAFDLALTDQAMPGCSGLELAAQFHAIRRGLPIVLVSGSVEFLDPMEIASAGVSAVLPKPYARTDLTQAVALALRGRPEA